MTRSLALLGLFTLVLSSCSSSSDSDLELSDTEEAAIESNIQVEDFDFSRDATLAFSDYVLEDNTGYGFAYDPSNVLDKDFSTAWCLPVISADDGPFAGTLTLSFSDSAAGKTLGIVPGFARDEAIYFQNNRAKTLALGDSASPLLEDAYTYELEDVYGMQFITLPDDLEKKQIWLSVPDVYPGSKYDDTCIAEIDLWSDWVEDEDADAAYDYYVKNKKDAALRPVGVDDVEFLFAMNSEFMADSSKNVYVSDLLTSCGAVDDSVEKVYESNSHWWYKYKGKRMSGYFDEELGWLGNAGDDAAISIKMNEWAEEGDKLTIKWWNDDSYHRPEVLQLELVQISEVEVKACDNGILYVSDSLGEQASRTGAFVVKIYFGDKLIGKDEFSLYQ